MDFELFLFIYKYQSRSDILHKIFLKSDGINVAKNVMWRLH